MAPFNISLPESLTAYLQEQIEASHYNTAEEYIHALIQQDKARTENLEPLLLEGLASGEATPMTAADWDKIRATVCQNLGNPPQHGSPN